MFGAERDWRMESEHLQQPELLARRLEQRRAAPLISHGRSTHALQHGHPPEDAPRGVNV